MGSERLGLTLAITFLSVYVLTLPPHPLQGVCIKGGIVHQLFNLLQFLLHGDVAQRQY